METPTYFALLREAEKYMDLSKVVLVGSAALAERELRDVNDLDVLVWPDEIERIRARCPEAFGTDHAIVIQTPAGVIQIADNMQAFAAETTVDAGDVFFRADRLEDPARQIIGIFDLMVFKKQIGREKDQDDLRLIDESSRKWHFR